MYKVKEKYYEQYIKTYDDINGNKIEYFIDEELLEELNNIVDFDIKNILEENGFLDENFLDKNVYGIEEKYILEYYNNLLELLNYFKKDYNLIYHYIYELKENIKNLLNVDNSIEEIQYNTLKNIFEIHDKKQNNNKRIYSNAVLDLYDESEFKQSNIFKDVNFNEINENNIDDFILEFNGQNLILLLLKLKEKNIKIGNNLFFETFINKEYNNNSGNGNRKISKEVEFNSDYIIILDDFFDKDNEFIKNFIGIENFEYLEDKKLYFKINPEIFNKLNLYYLVIEEINKISNIRNRTLSEQSLFLEDIIEDDYFNFDELIALHEINIDKFVDLSLKNSKNENNINYVSINKNSISKLENKDIEKEIFFDNFYEIYRKNYDDNNFLLSTKNDLEDLIINEKFLKLYLFYIKNKAILSLYTKEINNDTIYIGGLNSNKYFSTGFKFAKKIVEKNGKDKNIEIIVYKEIGGKKNRYRGLIKSYEKMGFILENKEYEKKYDNKIVATYFKMRKPKKNNKKVSNNYSI